MMREPLIHATSHQILHISLSLPNPPPRILESRKMKFNQAMDAPVDNLPKINEILYVIRRPLHCYHT